MKIRFGQSSCGIVFRLRDGFFGLLAFKSRQAKIGWKSLSQNQLPSSSQELTGQQCQLPSSSQELTGQQCLGVYPNTCWTLEELLGKDALFDKPSEQRQTKFESEPKPESKPVVN